MSNFWNDENAGGVLTPSELEERQEIILMILNDFEDIDYAWSSGASDLFEYIQPDSTERYDCFYRCACNYLNGTIKNPHYFIQYYKQSVKNSL